MLRKIILVIAAILVGFLLLITLFVLAVNIGLFGSLPGKAELMSYRNKTASLVWSEEGELIGKYFAQNRTNITYPQIPPHLIQALVATEDARYFEHEGIDSRSLLRVLFKSVLAGDRDSGGGSTISQQLVKNMYGRRNHGLLTMPVNKTREAILARRMERNFSKEEILALYLNTVPFGENVYGIEAATQRFFNKSVEYLRAEESAVLIGMLKANTLYNPRLHPESARSRRNVVLMQMARYRFITDVESDSLARLPLVLDYANLESRGPAHYFLVRVEQEARRILNGIREVTGREWNLEEDGLQIRTSLNLVMQRYANRAFRDHLSVMQKRLEAQYRTDYYKRELQEITASELRRLGLYERAGERRLQELFTWDGYRSDSITLADSLRQSLLLLHAGLLVLDPVTGAIRTWVGGIDFRTQPYDQVMARRQLASTFKPVVYAAALELGVKPCHYLDNDPIILRTPEPWSPSNFDHTSGGNYSLAGALIRSMNIPTVNLFFQVGFDPLDQLWRKMGFGFRLAYNPSLALGTAEANLLETAVAYAAFANGGLLVEPSAIVSISTPDGQVLYQNSYAGTGERVMSRETAALISRILQRAVREGTGTTLGTVYGVNLAVAGKTGTSNNYGDAWFAAFNPALVMVSRVGASTTAIHFSQSANGTGNALALPLVGRTLRSVQSNPVLRERFFAPFEPLSPQLEKLLECPDFREDNLIDKLEDLIIKEVEPTKEGERTIRKAIRSILDIFKKKR
ncbi:MAG: transglycosylase domain-containing protein [Bacteroidales bacterium]